MKTLKEVKGDCRLDDGGHWIWAGGMGADGRARIHAPDFTLDTSGATYRVQAGRRAVWHIKTRAPIAAGHSIYSTCRVVGCHRPSCLISETAQQHGARIRETGEWRGSVMRRLVNRRSTACQRVITDAQAAEIQQSEESNSALAAKLKVSNHTIAKYRRGLSKSVPNHFQGLMS